tara:strand:- start:166 stop:594 length:429 start_codon:yes stop_codon:yes gene_type:complete
MIPAEILTMAGGSLVGFFFKLVAKRAENEQKRFEMFMKEKKLADESADKAVKRVSVDGGKWVRRLIVVSVLFGVILAPFITTFMNHPIVVEELITKKILWGLLGTKTVPVFVEVEGYLLVPEIRQALTAIIGFYFGQATVKR